jgi:hypothetical protein
MGWTPGYAPWKNFPRRPGVGVGGIDPNSLADIQKRVRGE